MQKLKEIIFPENEPNVQENAENEKIKINQMQIK